MNLKNRIEGQRETVLRECANASILSFGLLTRTVRERTQHRFPGLDEQRSRLSGDLWATATHNSAIDQTGFQLSRFPIVTSLLTFCRQRKLHVGLLYARRSFEILSLQRRSCNEALQLLGPRRFDRQNLSGNEGKRRGVKKAPEDKKQRTSQLVNFDRKIVQVVVFVAFGGTWGNEGRDPMVDRDSRAEVFSFFPLCWILFERKREDRDREPK